MRYLSGLIVFALAISCGMFKKKSDDDDSSPSTSSSTVNYPSSLALSSPTEASVTTTSLTASAPLSLDEAPESTSDKPVADKIAENKDALNGSGENGCLPRNLVQIKITEPSCFANGFTVTGSNTADAANPFITVPTTLAVLPESGQRGMRRGDGGIQAEGVIPDGQTKSSACAAEAAKFYVARVSEFVNKGNSLTTGMACAIEKAGIKFPAVGESITVTDTIKTSWAKANFITVSEAKIKTVAENTFQYVITGSFRRKDGVTAKSTTMLTTKPDTSDLNKKKGVLVAFEKAPGRNEAGAGEGTVAVSVQFDVAKDTQFYNAQRFSIASAASPTDYLKSDGTFDFASMTTKIANDATFASRIGNMTRVIANLNADGTGKLVHAWQAGTNDIATRVLAVKVDRATDGSLSGFGAFGFSHPFKDEASKGPAGSLLTGMYCGWAQFNSGTNIGASLTAKVQEQRFTKTSTDKFWTVKSTNADFTIAADCGATNRLVDLPSDKKGTTNVPAPTVATVDLGSTDVKSGVTAP